MVEVFRWTPVLWFFPHRVFHVKISVLMCVIVALYLFIVWFCFYCTKREKDWDLWIVNCIPLNWSGYLYLVFPTPTSYIMFMAKGNEIKHGWELAIFKKQKEMLTMIVEGWTQKYHDCKIKVKKERHAKGEKR
jgi:hypothetical protein